MVPLRLMPVPHFSKVVGKSSRLEVFCKKPQVFSCQFFKVFKNNFLHRANPVADSEKLKAEAVVLRCSGKKMLLDISKFR